MKSVAEDDVIYRTIDSALQCGCRLIGKRSQVHCRLFAKIQKCLIRQSMHRVLPCEKAGKYCHIQLFRERLSEKMCIRQSRKVIWDMFNTLFLTLQLSNQLLLFSFSTCRHMSMTSPAILLNFFEKQCTQNHPQYLSGLSHALYATTFLKIAVQAIQFTYLPTPRVQKSGDWKSSTMSEYSPKIT